MNLKELFLENWKFAIGDIYIPAELKQSQGELLIHISDTPAMSYNALDKLLKTLKPKWIVHTGDLVDNIKLELSFSKIDLYKTYLKRLAKILEDTGSKVYISLGNHDHYEAVMALKTPFHVVKKADFLQINAINVVYSHYIEQIADYDANVYLFGHNKYKKTELTSQGKVYLNGLEQIAVLDMTNHCYYYLKYPIGTDDSRLLKMRIGI